MNCYIVFYIANSLWQYKIRSPKCIYFILLNKLGQFYNVPCLCPSNYAWFYNSMPIIRQNKFWQNCCSTKQKILMLRISFYPVSYYFISTSRYSRVCTSFKNSCINSYSHISFTICPILSFFLAILPTFSNYILLVYPHYL